MSQVIKLNTPDPYKEIKDSIRQVTDEAIEQVKDEKVIGYCLVILKQDGSSKFAHSEGLERQRRIGILMDIVHDLCNA